MGVKGDLYIVRTGGSLDCVSWLCDSKGMWCLLILNLLRTRDEVAVALAIAFSLLILLSIRSIYTIENHHYISFITLVHLIH